MLLSGRFDTSGFPPPRHHRSPRSQSAFQYLVPADDVPATAVDKLLDTVYEPALQGRLIGQIQLLHQRLAMAAFFPCFLRTLIASDVDIVAGEEVDDFSQHVFQKPECVFFRTIYLIKYVVVVAHHIRLAQSA